MSFSVVHSLDVAHPPLPASVIEDELSRLVRQPGPVRVIKVIHGYGSSGRGGSTREAVRNWAFRQRGRLRGVIEGERYCFSDATTEEMIKETGVHRDPDLNAGNPGITLIWIR